jgi:predicted TIM-barrel fold metal-dependent hydrolase
MLKTFQITVPFRTFSFCLLAGAFFILACNSKTSESDENPNMDQYYSVGDYPDVEKIDTHIHIFTASDDFMELAKENNFKVIDVALDPKNTWAEVRREFRYCQEQKKNHPSSVEIVTSFSMEGWDEPDWLDKTMAWLDSSINNGAIGVKVWKNIGMVYRDKKSKLIMIDDPRFDPIFKMLAQKNIRVLGHLGEPKNCWLPLEEMSTNNDRNYFRRNPQYHMYQHPDLPTYEEQIAARDRMLEKNPDLTFIGAHVGSLEWSVDELAKRLDKFPNMAVDLAARMGQIFYQTHGDREKVREFFIKYQDRVIYATDMGASETDTKESLAKELHDTWMRDWTFFVSDDSLTSSLVNEQYKGLKLPTQVVDKIFAGNAKKWFGAFQERNTATPVKSVLDR